jgi:hypothetical protein
MQIDSNWALFVEGKEVKWSFGNPDDEFLTFVVNFLTALSQIGEELFGQHGIAQIQFDIPKHQGFLPAEVFIVNLMNKFFLIMSDPAVTLKLIETSGGIYHEVQEIMSAVLVGQAAMLFSQNISEASQETAKEIESKWQNIILDISDEYSADIEKIIGKDSSNFSMLRFHDLIFLHYQLRKQPEFTDPITPEGWALVSHMSGGEVPFVYHVEKDPVILAGYLAIIISFLMSLFESKPKQLVFGTNNLQNLSFVHGEDYFLAIDSPFTLLASNDDFREEFFEMKEKILEDLGMNLRNRLIEEILSIKSLEYERMDAKSLLEKHIIDIKLDEQQPKVKRIKSRIFGRW